ncbi:MAG TPA: toll/interleukin-1 receptor domain-containing protein [Aggregatilineaceae bacterium]|nr:toll/interleukin-1 receptor domain-containing protein [Aggregatilineaceae bacterium]
MSALPQLPDYALVLRVFISYSRQDRLFVDAVHAYLTACGETPHPGLTLTTIWYDQRSIPPGQEWEKVLIDGLLSTDLVVLFVSPDSMTSEYVQQEIELAHLHDKPIVPVLYRPVIENPPALQGAAWEFYTAVRRLQWISLEGIEFPYTVHPQLSLLSSTLEEAWGSKVERLLASPHDAKIERRIICDLYKTDHPWAVRFLDQRIEVLMRQSPPNERRAQYFAHALACIQAANGPATWDARLNWWRAEISPVHTQLLEYAARNPTPPC